MSNLFRPIDNVAVPDNRSQVVRAKTIEVDLLAGRAPVGEIVAKELADKGVYPIAILSPGMMPISLPIISVDQVAAGVTVSIGTEKKPELFFKDVSLAVVIKSQEATDKTLLHAPIDAQQLIMTIKGDPKGKAGKFRVAFSFVTYDRTDTNE